MAPPIRIGDKDGVGSVYSTFGGILLRPGEEVLHQVADCDMHVQTPWRNWFPKTLFQMLSKKSPSQLYITTRRIVFLRKVNVWLEVKGDLYSLGLPTAMAKEQRLKQLELENARQFVEIRPDRLKLAKVRRRRLGIDLFLEGDDGVRYLVAFVSDDKKDLSTFSLIESRFRQTGSPTGGSG
jgi:hypothetical protein